MTSVCDSAQLAIAFPLLHENVVNVASEVPGDGSGVVGFGVASYMHRLRLQKVGRKYCVISGSKQASLPTDRLHKAGMKYCVILESNQAALLQVANVEATQFSWTEGLRVFHTHVHVEVLVDVQSRRGPRAFHVEQPGIHSSGCRTFGIDFWLSL